MLLSVFKKIITLFVLVDPISLIPLFLASVKGSSEDVKKRFALAIATTVCIALLVAGLFGNVILQTIGVSIGSLQISGGILAFILGIAMTMGHESIVRHNRSEDRAAIEKHGGSVVPLGIPLLAGPAAISFVMADRGWGSIEGAAVVSIPVVAVGLATWVIYRSAIKYEAKIDPASLTLVQRLGGFLLSALAVELIVSGIKSVSAS